METRKVESREDLVREFHRHVGQPADVDIGFQVVKRIFSKVEAAPAEAAAADALEKSTNAGLEATAAFVHAMAGKCLAVWESIGPVESRDVRLLRAHLILEECAEVMAELARRDETALLKELTDLSYVVDGTAVTFGLPIEAAFAEVHASNMTKDAGCWKRRTGDKGKGPNYRKADVAKVMAAHKERKTDGNGK